MLLPNTVVNTTFKLGPYFCARCHQKHHTVYVYCLYQCSKLRMNVTFDLMERLIIYKLTAGVWHPLVQQKAGRLHIVLHPQPLLWCSKEGESQIEVHFAISPHSALFPFLCRYNCISDFLWSVWHQVAMVYPLSASPMPIFRKLLPYLEVHIILK